MLTTSAASSQSSSMSSDSLKTTNATHCNGTSIEVILEGQKLFLD